MKIKFYCVVIAVVTAIMVAPLYGNAVNERAEFILAKQSAYFQGISSLEFKSTTLLNENEQLLAVRERSKTGIISQQKLVVSGSKYYAEESFADNGKGNSYNRIVAYDGAVTQDVSDGGIMRIKRGPSAYKNVYHAWTLITAPFAFAFTKGVDEISVDTLRQPATWTKLANDVVSVKDNVSMLGHTGCTLVFSKSQSDGSKHTYEVFFAKDLGYFPLHSKADFISGKTYGELTVKEFIDIPVGTGEVVFPAAVFIEDYFSGGTSKQENLITLDAGSLKINQAVAADAFTIPASKSKGTYDTDLEMMTTPSK